MMELLNKFKSVVINKGVIWFFYFTFNPKLWFLSKERRDDLAVIKKQKIIYQPINFPEGFTIPKKSDSTIISPEIKLKKFNIGISFKNKTVLDIGSAEGYFLIRAGLEGAKRVLGIDTDPSRVEIAQRLINAWKLNRNVQVKNIGFDRLNSREKYDIVLCFSVIHHYHKANPSDPIAFLDTWEVITNPKYKNHLNLMLKYVKKIADLTKEVTYWEYPYTYKGYKTKPGDVNFHLLAKKWEEAGIYKKVEFLGFSDRNQVKDRALYRATKHDYVRDDKGFYMDFNSKSVKIFYTLNPSAYSLKERQKAFENSLSSLLYFRKIDWNRAPKLINYSKTGKFIEIEKLNAKPLIDLINSKQLDLGNFKKEFQELEKSLSQFKINYCSGTLGDLMINKKGKLFLVDFEKTITNYPYKMTLSSELLMDLFRKAFNRRLRFNTQTRQLAIFLALQSVKSVKH